MSEKRDKRLRNQAIGLWRRFQAGETVRQIAEDVGKPAAWVSKRLKIGERFADETKVGS